MLNNDSNQSEQLIDISSAMNPIKPYGDMLNNDLIEFEQLVEICSAMTLSEPLIQILLDLSNL